jgi:predicted DsbA family dithiol-disulfide isomerase
MHGVRVVEVFADVRCPFTHVGLRRFVERRRACGQNEVVLRVRAWPLELVNGAPLDPAVVAEEIEALRAEVAADLFTGFGTRRFGPTSLPALDLAAAAYATSLEASEQVSLGLRDACFERGEDVTAPSVLASIAEQAGVDLPGDEVREQVLADWHEGQERGVIGSPHFFLGDRDWFSPSVHVSHSAGGYQVRYEPTELDAFFDACFPG